MVAQLEPPFTKDNQLCDDNQVILPAYIPNLDITPSSQTVDYLDIDLTTPRIDGIHPHLWLAGLPKAARSLGRQQLMGRNIIITEDPNEHLVWHQTRMFIKPLPAYLLNHQFWTDHLTNDPSLHACACGFLLSYSWLIVRESDLSKAHSAGILPPSITYQKWTSFISDFIKAVDPQSLASVSKRYHFGELRLSRLNRIYKYLPPKSPIPKIIGGSFMSQSTWPSAFLERNFAWLLPVFGYSSIVLSAMQVGLGTTRLQGNYQFEMASVVFTTASMVAVAASVGFVLVVWVFLFFYHVLWALRNLKGARRKRLSRKNID